jgi:hypothetical protein
MKSKVFLVAICTLFLSTSMSFGYQATFTPRISVGTEYTDNYHLTDSNKEDEYITIISPGFTAQILGKNSGAEISYDPSYAMYDQFDESDTWRHRALFSGWTELSKNTKLEVRDSFHLTEDPVPEGDIEASRDEDPDVPIDSTIRRSRETYYTNTAGVNLLHQFGQSDSFNLGYDYSFLKNDDPSIEDNERHNPYGELTYWFAPEWGFNMRVSYIIGEYDVSDDFTEMVESARLIKKFSSILEGFVEFRYGSFDYDGNSEDAQGYNLSAGFDYGISSDTSFSLLAGYYLLDRERSDDESGPSVNVDLTKTFSRGAIRLTGSGGFAGPGFGAETLGISQFYEVGCSATYQLSRHISGNAFGSYRYDDYIEETPDREDKTTIVGLGLTMQALEWMSLGLDYRYRTLDSDADEGYDENRVLFRITLSPSRPFRTSRY